MPSQPETVEETAERLAPIALALVRRIRSEPVDQLRHELLTGLSERDKDGLIMLLAAAVDPNVDPDIWWGWVRYRGEIAAARRLDDPDPEPPLVPVARPDVDTTVDRMLAAGWSHRAIAAETGLSPSSVLRRGRRLRAAAQGGAVAA